ncbi:unnamed protein product [Amaranthus hypochondriacus]
MCPREGERNSDSAAKVSKLGKLNVPAEHRYHGNRNRHFSNAIAGPRRHDRTINPPPLFQPVSTHHLKPSTIAQYDNRFQNHFHPFTHRLPSDNPFQNHFHPLTHRSPSGLWLGHRGLSRLPWRRGPREPPLPAGGPRAGTPIFLFVDFLPRGVSPDWLRDLFSEFRMVEDVFISKKVRKGRDDVFGFVRYKRLVDAKSAVEKLNGHVIKNSKICVSLARFDRNGKFCHDTFYFNGENKLHQYGRRATSIESIPILFSINVKENLELVQKLKFGVIAESAKPINLSLVAASVSSLNLPFAGMNSLSPCKIILFFDNDDVVQKALEDGSALWDLFDDLRGWIEGEFFDDRLMWIECFECGSIVCKPMERARTKYDTLNLKPTDKQSVSPVSASKGYVSDSVNALEVRNNDIRVFLDISDVNQIVSNPDALVSGMINRTNDSLAMNRMDPCDLDE